MNKKKLLALLMALVMTFSLVPTTVWATGSAQEDGDVASLTSGNSTSYYTSLAEAVEAAQENDTVALLKPVTVDSKIVITKNLTLDLNGFAVTNNVPNSRMIRLGNGATLRIIGDGATVSTPDDNKTSFGFVDLSDGTNAPTGAERLIISDATFEGATYAGSFFRARENGQSITLTNVNATAKVVERDSKTGDWFFGENYSIVSADNISVTLTITGGTYTYDSVDKGRTSGVFQVGKRKETGIRDVNTSINMTNVTVVTDFGPIIESHGTVTINNCSFADPTNPGLVQYLGTAVAAANYADVTVDGGTYCGLHAVYVYNTGGVITIKGGTYIGKTNGAAIHIDNNGKISENISTVIVEGGTFIGALYSQNGSVLSIRGGYFSADPTAYVDSESFTVVELTGNESGSDATAYAAGARYKVVSTKAYVAQIGDAKYETLAEAVTAAQSGGIITLLEDIDLSNWQSFGTVGTIDGNNGSSTGGESFSGTLDGDGHTITGLNANLFNSLKGATIQNLIIDDATIEDGGSCVGALAGYAYNSNISNVTVKGALNITGTHFVGGVVGYAASTSMNNVDVTATGTISATDSTGEDGDDVGGVVGYFGPSATLTGCDVNGSDQLTISADRQAGGLAGISSAAGTITNCSVSGVTVQCTANESTNSKKADKIAFGGLVSSFNSSCGAISGCTVSGVTLNAAAGANTTNARVGIISAGRYDKSKTNALPTISATATGNTLEISSASELGSFRDAVNAGNSFHGNTVKLTADIDLNDVIWTPIGYSARKSYANHSAEELSANPYFGGTFDGNGHTIIGLSNYNSNSYYEPVAASISQNEYVYGLFGAVGNGATIQNVTLTNVDIDTTKTTSVVGDSVGALAGYAFGDFTVSNVSVSGTVKANDAVGGIVGRAYKGNYTDTTQYTLSLTGNTSSATVIGGTASGAKAGGLFGYVSDNSKGYYTIIMTGNSFTGGTAVSGYFNSPIAVFDKTMFNTNFSTSTAAGHTNTSITVNSNTANGNTTEWDRDNANNVVFLKQVEPDYVAEIGTTKYETLQAAFNNVQDGQTITLLDNVNLTERLFVNAGATPAYAGTNNRYATTSADKSITLDLNGKNITSSSNIALAGGSLNITGTGTISTSTSGLAPVEIRGTGDLTSKRTLTIGQNVTLEGEEYGLNVFGSNDVQKNVIDVNVNGTVKGMLFVLGNLKNADNAINIVVNGKVDASEATGTSEEVHTGIAINGNANVTVNNGATVKGESGIEVRAGSLTVDGGTITATATTYSYEANDNGTTTKGAAIAVAQHNTKLAVNATLNGGTLEGIKQISVTDVNSDMNDVNVVASAIYTENSVIPEGYKWVNGTTTGTKTLAEITPVAQVGTTEYTTLEDAVNAITGTSGIITLLANIDLANDPLTDEYGYANVAPENKTITLDLSTYTISGGALDVYGTLNITGSGTITGLRNGIYVNEGGALNVQSGTITTTGKGYPVIAYPGTVNITGGTVTNGTNGLGAVYVYNGRLDISGGVITSNKDDTDAICIAGTTTATISGGTVTGHDWGVTVFGTAQLTVSGNAIIGTDDDEGYAISTNGNGGQNATVTINGGTITGKELGIYQPSGKLTVTDGTIRGATGIYFKSNSLNITGGTIVGNGAEVAYNYNGNGANPTGDALVIDSCGYPNGINDVAVSGGQFQSDNAKAVACYTYKQNAPVINFITGGKYSSEPDSSYVADGYKAANISEADYEFQVGVVDVAPTIEGSIDDNSGSVTFKVTTTVKENKDSESSLESYTNLSVTVSGTDTESTSQTEATVAVAALSNIKNNDTLSKIVTEAIEAAGASITQATAADANTETQIVIQVAKSAPEKTTDTQEPEKVTKVTYEVHPEAVISVIENKGQTGEKTTEVGTVKLSNSQITNTFSFKLYAGDIDGVGTSDKIKVTHIHDDGTSEELGPFEVDSDGYIKVTGVTEFSNFELEKVEEQTTGSATFGYTISLEDSINIVFNVKNLTGELSKYSVAYGFGETQTNDWAVRYPENATLNSYIIGSFAAKEMGDRVHVIVKYNDTVIKDAYYSIKGYCDTIINGNYGAEITNLCKATLDYGRYAQETFNYNMGSLVNGGSDYFVNSNINVPGYTPTKTNNGSTVTGVSLSLVTTSKTQLVAYFKMDGTPNSVTVNDDLYTKWTTENGRVKVVVEGIAAKDLDKDVTIVVADSSGNYTYVVSPVDYMGLAVGTNSQVSVNRAFYNYYLKAAAYFASK